MLYLIHNSSDKKKYQKQLERELKRELDIKRKQKVGYQGGFGEMDIYVAGDKKLYVGFNELKPEDCKIPRYWNAFGIFQSDKSMHHITVEINISTNSNTQQVAGFFAEDSMTGDIFLMHDGKVGGGRKGVGKSAFLTWTTKKLTYVVDKKSNNRTGIIIAKLGNRDLVDRIWSFVKHVQEYKNKIGSGELNPNARNFKQRKKETAQYIKEFSGRKSGVHGGSLEYDTYHGDVVDKLREDLSKRKSKGEKIYNTKLVDLGVWKDGKLIELYEVKTSIERQNLYTAIGQLLTHATDKGKSNVIKFLVIPESTKQIPKDVKKTIQALGIRIRRFRLTGRAQKRVELK